jgi:hypothetical protein
MESSEEPHENYENETDLSFFESKEDPNEKYLKYGFTAQEYENCVKV